MPPFGAFSSSENQRRPAYFIGSSLASRNHVGKAPFLFCFVLFESACPESGLINDAVADGDGGGGEVWPRQVVGTFAPQVKHCFSPSFPLTAFHGTDSREKKRKRITFCGHF